MQQYVTELRFDVLLDTKQVIQETFFPVNLFVWNYNTDSCTMQVKRSAQQKST